MPILSLNGPWQLRQAGSDLAHEALVPGCVHLDLHRAEVIPDPFWGANELDLQWIEEAAWEYSRHFEVTPEMLAHENVDLLCDGLDTLATIEINGQIVARTQNMFVGFRFEASKYLRAGGNEISIHFSSPMEHIRSRLPIHQFAEWNDAVGGSSNIRKQQCSFGWDWGPRFATSGIYKDISLHAWSLNRIERVRVTQHHEAHQVLVHVEPTLAHNKGIVRCRLSRGGEVLGQVLGEAQGSGKLEIAVENPQLWWPNGLGAQPLYDLEVELVEGPQVLDTHRQRIGLRLIELDRHADEWGESFQFKVNGRAIFAKGANWIPNHAFVTEETHQSLDNVLRSAAEANMNMLRVWGGGIYESDDFYDICDERGILVWQDFMFACSLYPGDEPFLQLVQQEAEFQVARLQSRACLALWCGNNEIEQMPDEILATPERKAAYEKVFYDILPHAVQVLDGVTVYWPSSPHNPEGYEKGFNNERAGDCHFWDVWHARHAVKRYEEMNFRFCSEFGMQSYSSPQVAATFCAPEDFNVFGPSMENHQKNPAGNQIIFDYVSRLYRFPKDYASLAYLSQLNQAYCMRIGIEHFRRSMPRTMGALYWQLNDCWPVFSWSSLEFGGKWKALHFEARRFFAPALISAHVPGDEKAGKANIIASDIAQVDLYTVYDGVGDKDGALNWALYNGRDEVLESSTQPVALRPNESKKQISLDFAPQIQEHGRRNLYLRVWLEAEGETASQQTVFFTAPRFLELKKARVGVQVLGSQVLQVLGGGDGSGEEEIELEFSSSVFQHRVAFEIEGVDCRASDNFFDLYAGVPHRVRVRAAGISGEEIGRRISTRSLVDSY